MRRFDVELGERIAESVDARMTMRRFGIDLDAVLKAALPGAVAPAPHGRPRRVGADQAQLGLARGTADHLGQDKFELG